MIIELPNHEVPENLTGISFLVHISSIFIAMFLVE